jgi:hypothetical protein
MEVNRRDLACGLIFAALGLAFVVYAWTTLPIGEAVAMGPGYFPMVLGVVLMALGAVVALSGRSGPTVQFPPVAWRGVGLIIAAVLFFGLTVRGLGMAPSLLVATFMAARAAPQVRPRSALIVSVVLTFFNIVVFVFALRLPYAIIGPWLGG